MRAQFNERTFEFGYSVQWMQNNLSGANFTLRGFARRPQPLLGSYSGSRNERSAATRRASRPPSYPRHLE